MTTKFFEVRDRYTFIPVYAIQVGDHATSCASDKERWLLRRCGWLPNESGVVMGRLIDGTASHCHTLWSNRTMKVAHLYAKEHWDELSSGDVIDVEFILGETKEKKVSERGQ